MHIVFISREYPPTRRGGGIASYIKELGGGLASAGHEVTVVCASDDTTCSSDSFVNGVRVIRLSGGDFALSCEKGYLPFKKLRCLYRFYSYRRKVREAILKLSDVDVIEVPDYGSEGYFLMDLPQISVVVRLHAPSFFLRKIFGGRKIGVACLYEWWLAWQEKKYVSRARHLSACSLGLANWISENLRVDVDKIKVLPNPISVSLTSADEVVKKAPRKGSILFSGTVANFKGVEELIDSCIMLRKEGIDLNLDIFGKIGSWGELLKAKMEKYPWCCFKGNVSREALIEEYASHEVCCFPSWWENFPMVCLEAMAYGGIVVGSNSGGMTEMITHGRDGFLVEPKSAQVLAKALEKVLALSEGSKNAMIEHARSKVERCFSSKALIPLFEEYYLSLISHSL